VGRKKFILLILDILLVIIAFTIVAWIKPATVRIVIPHYDSPLLIFLVIWMLISFLSGKYNVFNKKRLYEICTPVLVSDFVILSIVLI
jgi:hypothetical protein